MRPAIGSIPEPIRPPDPLKALPALVIPGLLWLVFQPFLPAFTRPPGTTERELRQNWGPPHDIFLRRQEIYPEFFSGKRLPAVEDHALGYRMTPFSGIVFYIAREGRITATYQGGT